MAFYSKQLTFNPQPTLKATVVYNKTAPDTNTSHTTGSYGTSKITPSSKYHDKFGYPKSILNNIPVLNNLSKEKNGLHPTQKPVGLLEFPLKIYTNEGVTVLDNVAGCGTTAIACLNLNGNRISIEKEKQYYGTAFNRLCEAMVN